MKHFLSLATISVILSAGLSGEASPGNPQEQSARRFIYEEETHTDCIVNSQVQRAFPNTTYRVPGEVPKELYSDGKGVTLWGNVIYSRAWGEDGETPMFNSYSFSAENGLEVSKIASDKYMFANGSGAFYDGRFHMVSKGYTTFLYCEYDVASWTVTRQEKSLTKFTKLVATDCDYDPVTGLTYGCFWNPEKKEYEFASVDYESCTHNSIAPMEIYSAIAINSKGVVYGIKESDGGLYTINKSTGEQNFIGLTGVMPYLLQSATFDRRNDVMYWAVRQVGSVAYLATVNTDNGSVKRLAYFPNAEQISCLYVPWSAEASAPASPCDCMVSPVGLTDKINITFTIPTKSTDGKRLRDNTISYDIALNGKIVKNGTGKPGSKVSETLKATYGYNTVAIKAENSSGVSAPAEFRRWCGPDTPSPVSNISVSIDNDADNKVTLSWQTPSTGIHGGTIPDGSLTFDVVRVPGNITVASNTSATTFTETLGPTNAGVHYYIVTPKSNNLTGEPMESPQIVATGVYSVPFVETFDTQASFEKFKLIDSNGDGVKWFYNKDLGMAEYLNGWKGGADDWLLSPEIYLKAGLLYELAFDCRGFDAYYTELLDIRVGSGEDISNYAEILPVTEIKTPDMKRMSVVFGVDADEAVRIAFHCSSSNYGMYLLIDNISLADGPAPGAPAPVTALAVEPDVTGLLSAKISFQAPLSCADNSPLSSIDKIDVLREDGSSVQSVTDIAPGEVITVTDNAPVNGMNRYMVFPSNSKGNGLVATAEAYIGQDIPWDPYPVSVEDEGTHYALSWTAPPDYGQSSRRGPVIVESLKYNIYDSSMSLLYENVEGLSHNIEGDILSGPQGMQSFNVTAVSPAGEGSSASSNAIIVGKPYPMPFSESFAGGITPSTFWWTGGYNVFNLSTEMSYDNDGGCIRWQSNRWDKTTWFNSGKIDISGSPTPYFSFVYRTVPGKQVKIKAFVSPDGGEDVMLGEIDFSGVTGEPSWQHASFNVAGYTDTRYVIVKIYVENNEPYVEDERIILYIDQIQVSDPFVANLAVTGFSVPETVFSGQTAEIGVNVSNKGIRTDGFKVKLYADDMIFGSRDCEGLEPQESQLFKFSFTPDNMSPDKIDFRAEVVYAPDSYGHDNVSPTEQVIIKQHDYPIVTDLKVINHGEHPSLVWSAPAQNPGKVFESFEDYVHKDRSFGSWITIDNDGGSVYSNQLVDVGYYNEPLAYTVFNSIAGGVSTDDAPYYEAHTGTTSLIAIASQPGTYKNGDRNDDWLISPELSASVEHHISLYAKSVKGDTYGMETFEILYSAGFPNDINSFVPIGSYSAPQEWTEYSADLPVGAKFFAIRYTGEDKFIFMIDDIEFEPGEMEVIGYNVFRNGKKIAYVSADNTNWIDAEIVFNPEMPETYNVSVVYANGESSLSNTGIYDSIGGVEFVSLPDGPFDVYSVGGICVRRAADNLSGLPAGVYVVENRKVIVR